MKLEDVKNDQLSNIGTKRIYGCLVEASPNFDAARPSSKWVTIRPCLCVWDSPESPCRCPSSILYWISEQDIRRSEQLDTKSHGGEHIVEFDIDKNAQIGVELLRGRPVLSIPSDQAEARNKLRAVVAKISRLKYARSQAAGSIATAGLAPEIIALRWDDFTDGLWGTLEDIGSFFDAGDYSGADWETLLGLILVLL